MRLHKVNKAFPVFPERVSYKNVSITIGIILILNGDEGFAVSAAARKEISAPDPSDPALQKSPDL